MRNSTQEQFKSNNCCRANERYADRVQIQDEERDKEKNQNSGGTGTLLHKNKQINK